MNHEELVEFILERTNVGRPAEVTHEQLRNAFKARSESVIEDIQAGVDRICAEHHLKAQKHSDFGIYVFERVQN